MESFEVIGPADLTALDAETAEAVVAGGNAKSDGACAADEDHPPALEAESDGACAANEDHPPALEASTPEWLRTPTAHEDASTAGLEAPAVVAAVTAGLAAAAADRKHAQATRATSPNQLSNGLLLLAVVAWLALLWHLPRFMPTAPLPRASPHSTPDVNGVATRLAMDAGQRADAIVASVLGAQMPGVFEAGLHKALEQVSSELREVTTKGYDKLLATAERALDAANDQVNELSATLAEERRRARQREEEHREEKKAHRAERAATAAQTDPPPPAAPDPRLALLEAQLAEERRAREAAEVALAASTAAAGRQRGGSGGGGGGGALRACEAQLDEARKALLGKLRKESRGAAKEDRKVDRLAAQLKEAQKRAELKEAELLKEREAKRDASGGRGGRGRCKSSWDDWKVPHDWRQRLRGWGVTDWDELMARLRSSSSDMAGWGWRRGVDAASKAWSPHCTLGPHGYLFDCAKSMARGLFDGPFPMM